MSHLSDNITIKHRYSRSVNLERDLYVTDSVIDYTPTLKAIDSLDRFLKAFSTKNSVRSWTITGVYGTGKSSFAHFLSSLCAANSDEIKTNALKVLEKSNYDIKNLEILPEKGLIRAVVTSQREPLSNSIIKALEKGTSFYFSEKNPIKTELIDLVKNIKSGETINSHKVLEIIKNLSQSSNGILLVIDELGKNLEYIAQNNSDDDLYLLQQIAELPATENSRVFVFCILHQSLSDYAFRLSRFQVEEWKKIEGRFEDLLFSESPEQMIKLIGNSIQRKKTSSLDSDVSEWSYNWFHFFKNLNTFSYLSKELIDSIYPLHPLSALILPVLCTKYAQNDRSIFTFLSSSEPNSFIDFIKKNQLEVIKIHNLYDYFVESVGISISSRSKLQRWIEIKDRIYEARNLGIEEINLLKTIGVLNLVSNSGYFKASKEFVISALLDNSTNHEKKEHFKNILESKELSYFITYRKSIDEFRIWDGSDFDIDKMLETEISSINLTTSDLLSKFYSLKPLIAQRHSYKIGSLRFFERRFCDLSNININTSCENFESDGLILYCFNEKEEKRKTIKELINIIPKKTNDDKPIIVVFLEKNITLKSLLSEFSGLKKIESQLNILQLDSVARKELNQRLYLTNKLLDDSLENAINPSQKQVTCFFNGKEEQIISRKDFNSKLSNLCDNFYNKSLKLWNELVNRRTLSTQGSTARKRLIDAMIKNESKECLGIVGFGPEFSMYQSLLFETGIHKFESDVYYFSKPNINSGIYDVWEFIENFCLSASENTKNIKDLYLNLEKPPFGVKIASIPILLLSVLLIHTNDLGLYYDGTFIPSIGAEHFDLLIKSPERFTIKYFQIEGLRAKFFKELEEIISRKSNKDTRTTTLLGVVKPLINFVNKLPSYTLRTNNLSERSLNIRRILNNAKEPDKLLFNDLPLALGFEPILAGDKDKHETIQLLKSELVKSLHELQTAYEKLLNLSKDLLYKAFSITPEKEKLRDDLYIRSNKLADSCIEPRLKSFIFAASNRDSSDKIWLESLLMIIADKPAVSWSDYDVIKFEADLSDMVRRFKNLEALQKELSNSPKDFIEAKRITLTKADGNEVHRMVWLSNIEAKESEKLVDDLLSKIKNDERLKDAVVSKLIEKAFENENSKADKKTKELKNG